MKIAMYGVAVVAAIALSVRTAVVVGMSEHQPRATGRRVPPLGAQMQSQLEKRSGVGQSAGDQDASAAAQTGRPCRTREGARRRRALALQAVHQPRTPRTLRAIDASRLSVPRAAGESDAHSSPRCHFSSRGSVEFTPPLIVALRTTGNRNQ
jgi:hypothetical protein